MQLVINGVRFSIQGDHSVRIDQDACVYVTTDSPAADEEPVVGRKRRARLANIVDDDDGPAADEEPVVGRKRRTRLAKIVDSDDDDDGPHSATGSCIGTYRVTRGMWMLVVEAHRAIWLYGPAETADCASNSNEAKMGYTGDSDGVWAFSDYEVDEEDFARSVPPTSTPPLCTHYVTAGDNDDIADIVPLPAMYAGYIQSFGANVASCIASKAESVYDNALSRGLKATRAIRAELMDCIEQGTTLEPLSRRNQLCTVCNIKRRTASYSFGSFAAGTTCAGYIRLAIRAHAAHQATGAGIVGPGAFVTHHDAVTVALIECAEPERRLQRAI